jgi:polyisoprenyl-teichoic acid--peptidoglycan teichoic acid transferase
LSAEGASEPPIRRRSPSIAAFLSFLWPGLGHAYTRRTRAALLFALPVLAVVLIVLIQAASGLGKLATLIISPSSALTAFILVVLLGVWREVAVIDAASAIRPRGSWRRGRSLLTISVITVIIAVTHLWAGAIAWALYDASRNVFVGLEGPDAGLPVATSVAGGGPYASGSAGAGPDDEYAVGPFATPLTAASRINILLTGVDSAETRNHALNDTLIVASIDPTNGDVALISFPRDISNFPMVNGDTYQGKINSYMTWVNNHPSDFKAKPLVELVKELSFLVGAPIHYYAAVDLAGFRKLIDAAGGVTIDNQRAIDDSGYDWLDGRRGFTLSVGKHHLDGENALAYVRSRYTPGDSDFNRARRQQEVLVALANNLTNPSMLPRLPALIEAAGQTVRTNFPSGRVGEMLELLQGRAGQKVRQVVLGPPYSYHPPNDQTGGIYTLRLQMDRLAKLSRDVFGDESTYPAPSASVTPSPTR